jgi:hypothetical protein
VALKDAFCIQISVQLSTGTGRGEEAKHLFHPTPEIFERNQNWKKKYHVYFNTETHNRTAILKDILKLLKQARKFSFCALPCPARNILVVLLLLFTYTYFAFQIK